MEKDRVRSIGDPETGDQSAFPTGNVLGKAKGPTNRAEKQKIKYSPKTKRRATRYAGVYTREAARIRGYFKI
jgi:hypothetical protein